MNIFLILNISRRINLKLFKENKSLGILLIVSIIYVGITFLFINPLRMKNNDLEKQKSEILTLHQQRNTINTISKKEKQVEDIILLIEKNIGSMVDITSIQIGSNSIKYAQLNDYISNNSYKQNPQEEVVNDLQDENSHTQQSNINLSKLKEVNVSTFLRKIRKI